MKENKKEIWFSALFNHYSSTSFINRIDSKDWTQTNGLETNSGNETE